MRTSLNELEQIEAFLAKDIQSPEGLIAEAKLLIDPTFEHQIEAQQKSYALIKAYGRTQLRIEIQQAQNQIFTQHKFKQFRNTILSFFTKL